MDAQTCLEKLKLVGVLAFATADESGAPQVRDISAIHYEADALYFFTAKGKDFCQQLLADGRVQALGYTKYKEMIRLTGKATPVDEIQRSSWIDRIFTDQPYLKNVYPGDSWQIGAVFVIRDMVIEYFNLGVRPIFRQTYALGAGRVKPRGYRIADSCIGCGLCAKLCPQQCVEAGSPYRINAEHCLHCGLCAERCPVSAVERL